MPDAISSACSRTPGCASSPPRADAPGSKRADNTAPVPASPAGDQVELTAAARNAATPSGDELRMQQRIAEIRRQIASDTYVTDDKLDAVVDRLVKELLG